MRFRRDDFDFQQGSRDDQRSHLTRAARRLVGLFLGAKELVYPAIMPGKLSLLSLAGSATMNTVILTTSPMPSPSLAGVLLIEVSTLTVWQGCRCPVFYIILVTLQRSRRLRGWEPCEW